MTKENPLLRVANGPHGAGVYTTQNRSIGSLILTFEGDLITTDAVPWILKPEDDRYLQVGPNTYVGPSGKTDDFVNHSCDPNCGVAITDHVAPLIAIRDISAGEEITFDYSTTMFNETWSIVCQCGTASCRGPIRNFAELPAETQQRYVGLGVVPAYILTELRQAPSKET